MLLWPPLLLLLLFISPENQSKIMLLTITEPTTARLTFEPARALLVTDSENNIYHLRTFDNLTTECVVNFPKNGTYQIKQAKGIKKSPLVYCDLSNFKLPEIERNRAKKGTKIVLNENLKGTPARIFTHKNIIEISPAFKKLPFQVQKFIIFHEIGHFFYSTEWKTDAFALYWFLKKGYNESNAYYSLSKILSRNNDNIERIQKMANHIINKTT